MLRSVLLLSSNITVLLRSLNMIFSWRLFDRKLNEIWELFFEFNDFAIYSLILWNIIMFHVSSLNVLFILHVGELRSVQLSKICLIDNKRLKDERMHKSTSNGEYKC